MWPAGAVLALDQATKLWALAFLTPGFAEPVLPGLNWTLVFNRGIAFSAFNNDARWQPWVFASLAAGVAVAIAILLVRTEKRPSLNGFGLALILAGALGNFVDRVRFGYVVDFIDCYYSVWHWPAFNVADSAITTGGALLILAIVRESRVGAAQ